MARALKILIVAAACLFAVLLWEQGGAGTSGRLVSAEPASEQPDGTLVFVSRSNRLTAIDVASGRRTVRRVGAVASCGPELFVTGGHVVFAGVRDGRTIVFSAPVTLDRAPTRLGGAHIFVPSATEGRVWLAGTDCSRKRMVGVREVAVDGRVTVESRRRVPGTWVDGAVESGLVIVRDRATAVWDPGTGRAGAELGVEGVTEARGSMLAGCTGRSDCRDLAILDTNSGHEVVARSSGRYRLELDAKLSPDRSLLATPARSGRRWRIALVNTRDGATRLIRGSATGTTYPALSWAASTGWLFIRAHGGRIKAYRPGAANAVTLPTRAPRGAIAFAAG
jgi:hypothetical protein